MSLLWAGKFLGPFTWYPLEKILFTEWSRATQTVISKLFSLYTGHLINLLMSGKWHSSVHYCRFVRVGSSVTDWKQLIIKPAETIFRRDPVFGDNCNEQIFLSHVFRGSKQIAYRQARQLSNLLVWQGRISAYFPSRFLNLLNPKHGLWKSSFYHWICFFGFHVGTFFGVEATWPSGWHAARWEPCRVCVGPAGPEDDWTVQCEVVVMKNFWWSSLL